MDVIFPSHNRSALLSLSLKWDPFGNYLGPSVVYLPCNVTSPLPFKLLYPTHYVLYTTLLSQPHISFPVSSSSSYHNPFHTSLGGSQSFLHSLSDGPCLTAICHCC